MPASMRGLRQLVHKSVDEKQDHIESMFDMMIVGQQRVGGVEGAVLLK